MHVLGIENITETGFQILPPPEMWYKQSSFHALVHHELCLTNALNSLTETIILIMTTVI